MLLMKFIADHAEDLIRACNFPQLSHAQLVGSTFKAQPLLAVDSNQQPVSLLNTDLFVDRKEILAFIKDIRKKWIFGPLLDGYEFFIVLPTTSVRHARTSSSGYSS
jgi:hypothetical protein